MQTVLCCQLGTRHRTLSQFLRPGAVRQLVRGASDDKASVNDDRQLTLVELNRPL